MVSGLMARHEYRTPFWFDAVECRTVGCGAVLEFPAVFGLPKALAAVDAGGWFMHPPWREGVDFPQIGRRTWCPACEESTFRGVGCRICEGHELEALMGHDPMGHRAARALQRGGFCTREQVCAASDVDLLDLPSVGKGLVRLIRTRL